MDAGLHGDDQIAVCRGHDDGQNARQRQTRESHRQNFDGQRRNHRVGRAVGDDLFRRNELMRDHAHEPHQRNRQSVDERSEEQAFFCRLLALRGKCTLPHFRACQRKDEIRNDIAHNAAVQIRRRQLGCEILQKSAHAAELGKRRGWNENIDKQNQHHELEYVRVDDAEQTRRCRVDDEHTARNNCPHLIGDADFVSEHVDDCRRRRNLRGDRAHHRKSNQRAKRDLRALAEALLEKVGDGGNAKRRADGGNPPGKA